MEQEMEVGRRKKRGAKKVKMPQVGFDLKAIREIKRRKKEVCRRYSERSKKRR